MSMPRILLIATALGLVGCSQGKRPAALSVASIAVQRPSVLQAFETVAVSGSVLPEGGASMVAFLVPGRTTQVLVREGEPVRKGQPLAVLDAVSLTQAHAAAQAQARAAQAAFERADAEFQRMKTLFESRSLAPNDFEKFKAGREAALQQHQQALAGEAIAKKNLAEATLQAPVAGHIARRMVEPGVMVAAGQPVFEIAAMDPMEVSVGVPETDIRLVKLGQKADVKVPALPGRTFEGVVKVVGMSADPATRTYVARIRVANPQRELKVGMVAEVVITGTQRRDAIAVPAEAIVRDPSGATLVFEFFPEQKRVYSRRVDVGAPLGRDLQIKAGLKGGEAIVVAGQHTLRDGMTAEVSTQAKR